MIVKADGQKCVRCWNYRELGVSAEHPQLCGRCAEVVMRIEKTV